MVKSCRFLSTGEESPILLAAATIALTLTATDVSFSGGAGDGGGDWALPPESSVRCDSRSHHRLPTTRLCGVPRLRTAGVRTRVLLGIPACLRRCRPALSAIPADRYRPALAMLRLRRLLRPRQNDRVSRRIESQRSSDKPPLGQRVVASRRSGVRTSITRTESFANLQTCYERLWQSPSSDDKCNQRNNQNDVDDRRFQQFLFRV